jgi:hypothetical protein
MDGRRESVLRLKCGSAVLSCPFPFPLPAVYYSFSACEQKDRTIDYEAAAAAAAQADKDFRVIPLDISGAGLYWHGWRCCLS